MRRRVPQWQGSTPKRGPRRGMTLIEVVFALVILTFATLSIGRYFGEFIAAASTSNFRATAAYLASDRIAEIRSSNSYANIDSYAVTETTSPVPAGFVRTTRVQHVGGGATDIMDYKVVTVSVTGPKISTPLKRTTVIAVF